MNNDAETKKMLGENSVLAVVMVIGMFYSFASSQTVDRDPGFEGSRMITSSLPFTGAATGGELIVADTLNRNMPVAVIETQAGESAESVAERLAAYIDNHNPFGWAGFRLGQKRITAQGGTVRGLAGGGYILAGTERGLGIPQSSPVSLTCTVDEDASVLLLNWEKPSGDYDMISLTYNWSGYDRRGGDRLEGDATSHIIDLKKRHLNVNDLDIWIVGLKNNMTSGIGAVHVSGNGRIQEEMYGIPFKNGVAPNWKAWSIDGGASDRMVRGSVRVGLSPVRQFVFEETETGTRTRLLHTPESRRRRLSDGPSTKDPALKPFVQVLETPSRGGTVGIQRQYLGLHPGHTYRITARLSTLAMGPDDSGWSYSLHAAADRPGHSGLSARQMAGLAALPDGRSGKEAGQMAAFGKDRTTEGDYKPCSAEITLPADSDSITVWLRFSAQSAGEVGFDWIKLEDLGK